MKLLERRARAFASDLTELLNGTVTNGVRISAVLVPPDRCLIGRGLTRTRLRSQVIDLGTGSRAPIAHLRIDLTLEMDDSAQHLAVAKSRVGLYADPAGRDPVCHYDYDRHPESDYPNAHVQVGGVSRALHAIHARRPGVSRDLADLHLPVGGRRFRPTIEDVIELVVTEGIAEARPGWKGVVAAHRERWWETQVKAAVRRWPVWAVDALRGQGYDIADREGSRVGS